MSFCNLRALARVVDKVKYFSTPATGKGASYHCLRLSRFVPGAKHSAVRYASRQGRLKIARCFNGGKWPLPSTESHRDG